MFSYHQNLLNHISGSVLHNKNFNNLRLGDIIMSEKNVFMKLMCKYEVKLVFNIILTNFS